MSRREQLQRRQHRLSCRINQMENDQPRQHHGTRIEQMETVQPKNHDGVRSAQKQEENIRSFKQGCAPEEEGENLTSHKQRFALEEEEQKLKYLKHSMEHLVFELQQHHGTRSILNQLIPLTHSIKELQSTQQKAHHDIRSVLEKEAENVKSLKQRIEQMETVQPKNHDGVRFAQKQEESIRSFKQGCAPEEEGENLTSHKQRQAPEQKEANPIPIQGSEQMEMVQQKNQDGTRSAQKQEENLRSFKRRMEEIEAFQQQQHNFIRSILQKDEKNLNLLKQRSQDPTEKPKSFIKKIEYVEGHQHDHHNFIRSALEQEKKTLEYLKQRITKLEEQLQQKSLALKAKEEELTSFKDRVAGEVALSMKTGSTISMNNPVNKFRLKEMYDDLRCFWPKIKHELKLNEKTPEDAKTVIQEQFKAAAADMKRKKEQLDDIFELKEEESEASLKVKQYRQSTAENLQLAIYSKKHAGSKKHPSIGCLPGPKGESPVDMMARLASDCYWLGSLMALNNPPLYPDWENHPPSMDPWDILPRNVRHAVEKGP